MTGRDMILAVLTSVIWGVGFVVSQFALQSFSAPHLVALRFVIAAMPVIFLPRPAISWRMLIGIGLSLYTGQFTLLFFAYKFGMPPGLASVTQQMHVFFTVLLAAILLHEIPRRNQSAGMAIAFAGLALIGLTAGADMTSTGFWLAIAGALSWGIGNILLKRVGASPMLALVSWASLVPPVPALLLSQFLDPTGPSLLSELRHSSWISLLAVLYLGGLATIAAYAMWSRLLARYPAAMIAPFALIAPCAGVLTAAIVFAERFSMWRYAGMALILIGLVIVVRPMRPAAAKI